MATTRRDESGAVAIIVALLAVVLLGVSALTVDLGQGFVKKRDIQKQTDFAALAGAAGDNLPKTTTGPACNIASPGGYSGNRAQPTDLAIVDTAAYLSTQPGGSDITPDQLADCDLRNGEAAYGTFSRDASGAHLNANKNQLSVISEPKTVNFGFAQVLGFNSVDVAGQATVEIKTLLRKTLPFYSFTGCDWGQKVIANPTNGQAANGVLLSHNAETNAALLNTLTTNPASTPAQVPLYVTDPSDGLKINANAGTLAGTTDVGFFLSGTNTSGPEPKTIDSTQFSVANGVLTIPHLPTAVTSVEAIWYVRVKIGGSWSPISTGSGSNTVLRALPLTVGSPSLTCGVGSNSGNFGTLDLPPDPVVAGINGDAKKQVAYNMIQGLSHGLSPFPKALAADPFYCEPPRPTGTIPWPADGTNCVPVKTGLDSDAAEMGFVLGIQNSSYNEGLLGEDTASASTKCPNNYPSSTTHLTSLRGHTINNDVLTCFFTNDSTTVSQVSSQTYTGPAVIDQSIYDSPRFVSVPVVGKQPGNGVSHDYEILDFRPAFITDQSAADNRISGAPIVSGCQSGNNFSGECNGLIYDHGQLNSVTLIFLNPKALPDPPMDPDGHYIPYTGSGAKRALLVN
jgi:hypothetical protein